MENFLVIGGGGREHAMAWKLATSQSCKNVYCCPGNGGTEREPKTRNVSLDWQDTGSLLNFISEHNIRVTLIGPEVPLVAGLADHLQKAGHFCFAPSAAAARLEGSKSFCKEFLRQQNIPTANYAVFTQYEAAVRHLDQCLFPCVVKYDGLAAGKGVTVAQNRQMALTALDDIYKKHKFETNDAQRVVIEDFLDGHELSFMVAADGAEYQSLATSQDHKQRDDGDKGPNTGGMGAYSPVPWAEALKEEVLSKIINPTLIGLMNKKTPYLGFLYAGLMIKNGDATVLEYNCRLGDPETQALLFGLETDLAEWLLHLCEGGNIRNLPLHRKKETIVTVVMASAGYPDAVKIGKTIQGLEISADPDVKVFHSGTRIGKSGECLTAGGRVLSITASGRNAEDARQKAYARIEKISWPGAFYRKDIGERKIS